jgi:hypothetical protein
MSLYTTSLVLDNLKLILGPVPGSQQPLRELCIPAQNAFLAI